jgi:hypothetical protein
VVVEGVAMMVVVEEVREVVVRWEEAGKAGGVEEERVGERKVAGVMEGEERVEVTVPGRCLQSRH